jgi:DNA-binding CsgD family transcriptional regulator
VTGAGTSATSEPQAWPIVGRAHELEQISSARGGDGRHGMVLMGPAGVGKSRLARAAITEAGERGALVEWVHATRSAAAVPLGALAALLPTEVRSDDALELMRFSAAALRERAAGRPIVVGVDDAHLLDGTSAALILHLAITGAAFVVATVRTGEPCPDAVVSLWKDAGAARLELRPLSERETGQLAESALGGAVETPVLRWIYDSSRGNVLYLRELLRGALDSGALEQAAGLWRLSRRPPPSRSLSELVSARMTGLSSEVTRTLELLALGEPLRLAELLELVGLEALQEAESRGLISVSPPAEGGEVALAHPVYGDVIDAQMPGSRAHAARLQLAEVVGRRRPRSPGDALRIARWLLDAGEPIAPDVLVEAARAAIRAGDADFGARLAELALGAGTRTQAALLLARAHYVRRRYAQAEAALAEVEGSLTSADEAAEYLVQRIGILLWGLEQPQQARALLGRARTWWPDDEAWRARLNAMDLQVKTLSEGYAGSVEASAALLADPALSEATRERVRPVHLANLFYSGRAREAYELSLRLRPPVPIPGQAHEFTLMVAAAAGVESGEDWSELRAWASAALRDAVRVSDHFTAGVAATVLGYLDAFGGRYRDAQRWFAEAEAQLERHDAVGSLVAARLFRAKAAAETGDVATATELLDQVERAQPGVTTPALQLDRAIVRARVLRAGGDLDGARAELLGMLEACADMPLHTAKLLYAAMRAGAPARELAAPMAAARERSDARLVAAYARHVDARATGDGAALLETAEAFAAIGADRYASEAAADAASAFASAGRQDSARRAAARSRELHADQGGREPEIRGVDAADVLLTPREAQLVELAARGMSNAEIAERLVLSVRTVESHMYRAMQKLGVSDRRALRSPPPPSA